MPEATFTIAKVFTKTGEHDGRKWTRYDVKPAEDEENRYSTFSETIGGKAQEWEGAKVTAVYEETERGNKITELSLIGPAPEGGKQTKLAESPETQRSIAAAVALKEAVATVTHTIKVDDDTDAITAKVTPLARRYFLLLNELSDGDQLEIPF